VEWEERDRLEKNETVTWDGPWMDDAFVDSFLEWVRNKIVSSARGKSRTLYEMANIESKSGPTHIDVILYKGFPPIGEMHKMKKLKTNLLVA
jgi:hypothetical protein